MTEFFLISGSVVFVYFTVLAVIYLTLSILSFRSLRAQRRREDYLGNDEVFASPLTPSISVVLPAYNEEAVIVDSVRSLLRLRYPHLELVVVSDGSTDATLERMIAAFDLAEVPLVLRGTAQCQPIRATFTSRRHPELIVVDKVNGGSKADAVNAGVNVAHGDFLCVLDADSVMDEASLLQVAKPLIDQPELVAASGGSVRVVNGCKVEDGRVIEARMPRSLLGSLQAIEYLRAFLIGRVGWNRLGALLIISGAFGLFRREVVDEIGGWNSASIGEDMEMVARMHHHLRGRGRPYRIEFVAAPVSWTEVPEDLRTLSNQRRRWQRGTYEVLRDHRQMVGNPRYGILGTLAMPYFFLFELLGPFVELFGYIAIPFGLIFGFLDPAFALAFTALALAVGLLFSITAIVFEEMTFKRYSRIRDLLKMALMAVLENFGYRQMLVVLRVKALLWDVRKGGSWGTMKRQGLGAQAS